MTYPIYKNKYSKSSVITPTEFVKYKKINFSLLPKNYILIYNKRLLKYFKIKYSRKFKKIKIFNHLTINKLDNLGLVFMEGVGSPHAVLVLEELIAMGGKNFISIGEAGGLISDGFFLCNKAIRDEGTSYHYLVSSLYAYPNKKLTEDLGMSMKKMNVLFSAGSSWTTDAFYRTTEKEIEYYRKQGIVTTEMEASALFSVASYRKVNIASAFIVSDILGKRWEPKHHMLNVKLGLNKLLEASIDCLSKK